MGKVHMAAQFSGMQSRADRTYKLTFNTQELGEDASQLMGMLMDQGWLLFSPNDDFKAEDIPEVKADAGLDEKSPSQRLRNVLFVYFKQKKPKQSWDAFYLEQMGRLVDIVKAKLEPEERG